MQPVVFVALISGYIWLIRPTDLEPLKVPLLALILCVPFASNFLHGDRITDLGLRLDNFWSSAREVGTATVLGATIIVAIGLVAGRTPELGPEQVHWFVLYPFWALLQQYGVQSFTYRRLREQVGVPTVAALGAAGLFATAHAPNTSLVVMTFVGGYVWCRLFERHPNLFTLAVSHGWLAVILRVSWPAEWLHNLRIGPGYWTWGP